MKISMNGKSVVLLVSMSMQARNNERDITEEMINEPRFSVMDTGYISSVNTGVD
jgi:hypothetical protein